MQLKYNATYKWTRVKGRVKYLRKNGEKKVRR